MAFSVVMPALEMAQETGKLVAWRKKEGEAVTKGEPLLEVETDKAVLEIEAPADGILAGISADTGAVIPVGKTIAWIVRPGEAHPQKEEVRAPDHKLSERKSAASVPGTRETRGSAEPRISPKARRLAAERGIDLRTLRGSGPDGEILASDVEAAGRSTPVAGGLSSVARLMAERTTQSWTTVPHFFVSRDVDAGALLDFRDRLQALPRITHTDLLVALVARTLRSHPRINASWINDSIQLHSEVSVGIAVGVEDGVVAGVIRNADALSLAEIAARRQELAERARENRLRPEDISGATFTISNLGMYAVDAFTAIIIPPQAAILAVGQIADRVVPLAGQPAIRPMMTLTLSCDHRVVDGVRAAQFLKDLVESLRQPENRLP